MILTEQTRQTVSRLGSDVENLRLTTVAKLSHSLELTLTASNELSELIAENRRLLSAGEIDPMEFGSNEELGIDLLQKWLEDSLSVLHLVDAIGEIANSEKANALRASVRIVRSDLQTRADSLRAIDTFLAKHPIPAGWNEEMVERNVEAVARGEGIDARDYLASLPR